MSANGDIPREAGGHGDAPPIAAASSTGASPNSAAPIDAAKTEPAAPLSASRISEGSLSESTATVSTDDAIASDVTLPSASAPLGSSLEDTGDPPPNEPVSHADRPGDTLFKKVSEPPPAVVDDDDASTSSATRAPNRFGFLKNRRALVAIAAAVLLGGGAIAVAKSGADAGHVEKGVTLAGTDLGGRDEASVRTALAEVEAKVAHRAIPLVLAGREVRFEPANAGFSTQVDAVTGSVMSAARASGFLGHLRALGRGRTDVPLVVELDDAALDELCDDWEKRLIDDHPSQGGIHFEGVTPVAELPQAGHRIQRAKLTEMIRAELARGGSEPIEVPIEEVHPSLAKADVDAALAKVSTLVKAPITLARAPSAEDVAEAEAAKEQRQKRVEEDKALAPKKLHKKKKKKGKRDDSGAPLAPPKPPPPIAIPTSLELVFTQADLVAMTRVTAKTDPPGLAVALDEGEIQRRIDAIANKLADSARDARFDVDDKDQVTISPSRAGTRVDPKKVEEAIFTAAATDERRGDLPVDHGAEPALTTEAAQKLGIKGLVAGFTTHHPCCQPRVINIHRIADVMDGALIKPGETFSVNKYVGPRTTDRGFVVAPSIGDGEMVETVGGGISQFATTLFNALFDGGYAIRERRAHSFYFNRYPMGIEATLSDPTPDLVFYNDTDAGLLIKTHYDKTSVTVKLYGDNGGRRVERHVSSILDVTDPKTEYEADDKLSPDKEKVKEKGSNGWSVWAGRTITFPSGEKREEKRKVTYHARPRLVRTHSCNIPKGEPDYTGRPCPKVEKSDDDDKDDSEKSPSDKNDVERSDPEKSSGSVALPPQ